MPTREIIKYVIEYTGLSRSWVYREIKKVNS
jgi:predicted DNA-binding transcriptional regulator AlpA